MYGFFLYIYIYTQMQIYMYMCVYICMYIYINNSAHIYNYMQLYTILYMYHTYIYRLHMYVYIRTIIYIYICIYIYILYHRPFSNKPIRSIRNLLIPDLQPPMLHLTPWYRSGVLQRQPLPRGPQHQEQQLPRVWLGTWLRAW